MAELRSKNNSTKLFIFSGLNDTERKDLSKKVVQLGAKYLDLKDFKTYCTHIITKTLTKSEKFLGGLATGKWILHPDYIHHSLTAGCWLDEEQYEFCDDKIMKNYPKADLELFYAPRRWRFLLGEHAFAFTGWKVAVVAGHKKAVVIKRLLISGGAEVYNLKLPVSRPERIADTIAYVFVSEQNVASVTSLFDYGVLCLKPEYIGDYLIRDPQPDVMNYLVQLNKETLSDVADLPAHDDSSFLALSQSTILSQTLSPVRTKEHKPMSSIPSSPLVIPENILSYKSANTSQITKPSTSINVEQSNSEKTDQTNEKSEVIDLTENDSDDNVNGKVPNTHPSSRKSRRLQSLSGKGSPVWKNLVPRSRSPIPKAAAADDGNQHTSDVSIVEKESASMVPVRPSSPLVRPEMVNTCRSSNTPQITKPEASVNVKEEKSTTPEKTDKTITTSVIDLTETNTDDTGDTQAASRQSSRLQSLGGRDSPVWKDLIPRSKTPVLPKVVLEVEQSRPCISSPINDKKVNKALPHVTSPITNFFKPLFIPKVEKEFNIEEEVEKALATSTPVSKAKQGSTDYQPLIIDCKEVEKAFTISMPISKTKQGSTDLQPMRDNCKENGDTGALPGERRKLKARKRLTTVSPIETKVIEDIKETKNTTDVTVPRVQASGDNCKTNPDDAIQRSTSVETLPKGDGHSSGSKDPGTSNEQKVVTKGKSHLGEVLLEMKRQKITACEWLPLTYSYNQRERETREDSVLLPITQTQIICSMLEEGYTILALNELNKLVSLRCVPPAKLLNIVLFQILQNSQDEMERHLAHKVFMKVLRVHPPITGDLQKLYLKALILHTGDESSIGSEWKCVLELISLIMYEEDVQKKRNSRLMLDVIMYMLQQNVQQYMLHKGHEHMILGTKHMLLKIIWCPSYYVVFNSRCKHLLDAMTETITLYRSETDKEKKKSLYKLLKDIMWLVAMVTEICRISECGSLSGLHCQSEERTSIFVHEISKRLIDADIKDTSLLHSILSMLQLPWLCVSICQQILKTFDDYLLTDEQSLDIKLVTLTVIVKKYIFLLPRFHHEIDSKTPIVNNHRQKKTEPLKNVSQNNKENMVESKTLLSKVNKRNAKGETPLHAACIKNDVAAMKRLLKIPGIDVNVKDNAGWTPLHEACNHGNMECVQELLKFVPSKTVDLYFSQGTKHNKRVDLLAGNEEGITPLHDAVLNNKLEVCRVLLQHGGNRLLTAQTCLGYSALDLAETEEMFQVLSSVLPGYPRRSDSQDSSFIDSQGSTSSSDDYKTDVPNDLLYNEVLYSAGKRRYTHTKSLQQYLHLILIMFTNYLLAANLRTVSEKLATKRTDRSVSVSNKCDHSVIVTEEYGPKMKVSSHEIQEMKRDLRIVRRLPYHLELFKCHLLKLCRPEDCDRIQTEFLSLQMLGESYT